MSGFVAKTARLTIRRMAVGDEQEAFAWRSDPRVSKYMLSSPLERPEDMLPFLRRLDPVSTTEIVTILHERSDGHAVGSVSVYKMPDSDVWSFGYCIRFEDWGKGYATEATRCLMEYARNYCGAKSFEAECAEENRASARVMEHLGMKLSGRSSYTKHDGSASFASRIYRIEYEE